MTHEIAYLKLVGGGYCPMSLPNDNNPFFTRQSGLALGNATTDPMDSPALAICAAREVVAAAAAPCEGVLLCEWKRLQRYAAAWPGRPLRLASLEDFPEEFAGQQTLEGFLHAAKLAGYAEALAALGVELIDAPFLTADELVPVFPGKEFHRKRFQRFAKALPMAPAVVASDADVAHFTSATGARPSTHLLGNGRVDAHFKENIVHFRRIRQLADGLADELERDRRRRGKFCGKFCDGGEMAEKDKCRQRGRAHAALTRSGMDVLAKVEQMWDGERSLDVLQGGLSADASRLIELILNAEVDEFDAEVARELHEDEPHNKGDAASAQRFFDSNMVHLVRIRQLADPERAMSVQPRFNQEGFEDERALVRDHYIPTWGQFGWVMGKPIERLWAGERDMEVLCRGCDPGVSALTALILVADDEHAEEATRRHRQRRGSTGANDRAEQLFERDKVSFRRVRQLADPDQALTQHPRFNRHGVEAEKVEVRDRLIPQWAASNWNIGPAIERLWAGERDLERVREGCDEPERRLMELVFSAHEDQHAADRRRAAERQGQDTGARPGTRSTCTACNRGYTVCFGSYGWRWNGDWDRNKQHADATPESPNLRFCSRECEELAPTTDGAGHSGEWRGGQYQQWCSHSEVREGPLCTHPGGILKREHWSCCGVTDRGAACTAGSGGAAAPAQSSGTRWQVASDSGWSDCEAAAQTQLTEAAAANVKRVTLERGQYTYDVDLTAMTQTNTQTGKVRAVRVQGGPGALARDCPNGHGLQAGHTPRDGYGCDVCHRDLPAGEAVQSCRQCNHDVCGRCFAAAGGSAPAAAAASAAPTSTTVPTRTEGVDSVDPNDPAVLQIVNFGFSHTQARVAVFHGRKQDINPDRMVEAAIDFILGNPSAGVPPQPAGDGSGRLLCPERHRLTAVGYARHDTFCDVCQQSPIHHVCEDAERHYDVCESCYTAAAGATEGVPTQQIEEGVPPAAAEPTAAEAPAPAPVPEAAAPAPPSQEELRAARLARFG